MFNQSSTRQRWYKKICVEINKRLIRNTQALSIFDLEQGELALFSGYGHLSLVVGEKPLFIPNRRLPHVLTLESSFVIELLIVSWLPPPVPNNLHIENMTSSFYYLFFQFRLDSITTLRVIVDRFIQTALGQNEPERLLCITRMLLQCSWNQWSMTASLLMVTVIVSFHFCSDRYCKCWRSVISRLKTVSLMLNHNLLWSQRQRGTFMLFLSRFLKKATNTDAELRKK